VRIEPLEGRLLLHAGHDHPVISSSSGGLSTLVDSADAFSLELSPRLSELDRLVAWVRDAAT